MLIDFVFFILGTIIGAFNLIGAGFTQLLPSPVVPAFTTIFATMNNLNDILPISTIVAALAAALVVGGAFQIWKTWWWVWKKIPFIGK